MNIIDIKFAGGAGEFFAVRTIPDVNFGSGADRACIVSAFDNGSLSVAVTSVVIDPTGANITMVPETSYGRDTMTGNSGFTRRFRYAGPDMPTGLKTVVITATGGADAILCARVMTMDGVTAIAAGVDAIVSGLTASVTVPSAAGHVVIGDFLAGGVPDLRTVAAVSPATLIRRVVVADHYLLQGAIVQSTSTGSSTVVAVSTSAGTKGLMTGWDLTLSAPAGTAPTITTQPSAQSVTAGATATFVAAATGSPTPTWQWQRSVNAGGAWSNISGATSASYTTPVTAVTGGSANNGDQYRVVATNTAGSATTNGVALTVSAAGVVPTITTQPSAQSVVAGATATFTASASGTPTPTWQWQRSTDSGGNWSNISGAVAASYTTPATTVTGGSANNGDQYRAVATNTAGSATSATAALTVSSSAVAPVITTNPTAQTVIAGNSVSFTVAATGTAPLSYQWRKGGANISGAVAATYTITSTATVDAGSYDCVVTNAQGSATSTAATLIVSAAPPPPPQIQVPILIGVDPLTGRLIHFM